MQPDRFAAMRIKEFQFFIFGRLLFITGLRMMSTVLAWWIYEVTHDPFAIGLIGLAEVIPAVSLALYAGHIIDITDRSKILRYSVMAFSFTIFLIFIISTSYFQNLFPENKWLPVLYGLIFITGAIRAFSGNAFHAIIAQLVPFEYLPNAITFNSGTFLTASITGHAMGGLLIAGMGIKNTLFISFILTVLASFFLSGISAKLPGEIKKDISAWQSVREGLAYVYKTKDLFAAMILDLFAVLFGGAVAMIPAFAKDVLNVGPTGFGWLNAAGDMGSMITVIGLALRPLKKNQGKTLLYVVAGFGLSIIVFGVSKSYLLSFIALFLSGVLDGVSTIIRGTIAQVKTPNEIKGRVLSVNSIFINSSNELGQFESGLAAKMLGLVPSVIFGGSMTLLVVIVTWFKAPTLKKLEY